jgi:hypothetical protein
MLDPAVVAFLTRQPGADAALSGAILAVYHAFNTPSILIVMDVTGEF